VRNAVTFALLALACACGGSRPRTTPPPPEADPDPVGTHAAQIAAQIQPYLEGEVLNSVVVGIVDLGKHEIYGFGAGPGGKPPTGRTLYDLGSITRVYTGLLAADAIQRKELELDAPVAGLVPPGITVPTRDGVAITVRHLVLHGSGLPPLPPSLLTRKAPPDPFAGYGEDQLYSDLLGTQLEVAPGTQIVPSHFGYGLLGFAIARRAGAAYEALLTERVLVPLGLRDTTFALPPGATGRRALGHDEDGHPVSRWTWGALASAGGLISTVRDQLTLLDAELDAAAGTTRGPLRGALKFTQEAQLDRSGENLGLGWSIDAAGRLAQQGITGGYRSFVGFDPKTKRGVVILASNPSIVVDVLGRTLFDVLDGTAKPATPAPTVDELASYAGGYNLAGSPFVVSAAKRRLYIEGQGEPRRRMIPIGPQTFWVDGLDALAHFDVDPSTKAVRGLMFKVGDKQLSAARVQ
jgi:serine-type D-Ala-D-Ala carboxypeptidase/endopeptidase